MTTERADIYNLLTVGVGGQGVISASNILAWAALRDNYKVRTAETHGMAQRGGSVSAYLRFGDMVEGPLIPKGSVSAILSFELVESLRNVSYANEETRFVVSTTKQISPTVLISRKVVVDPEKCVGCGNCISYCYPHHLKTVAHPPYTYIPKSPVDVYNGQRGDIQLCTGCGLCVDNKVCSFDAMEIKLEYYYPSLEEILDNVKKISKYVYLLDARKLALEAGNARTQNTVMIGFLSGLGILPIDREILFNAVIERVPKKAIDANEKAFNLGEKAALEYDADGMEAEYVNAEKKSKRQAEVVQ